MMLMLFVLVLASMLCYSICCVIMLIRFLYFHKVDASIVNRCIHTLTFQGEGENPSRHESEGALLILLLYVGFMMEVC